MNLTYNKHIKIATLLNKMVLNFFLIFYIIKIIKNTFKKLQKYILKHIPEKSKQRLIYNSKKKFNGQNDKSLKI